MSIYKLSYQYRENGVILRRSALVEASSMLEAEKKLCSKHVDKHGTSPDFRFTGKSYCTSVNYLIV